MVLAGIYVLGILATWYVDRKVMNNSAYWVNNLSSYVMWPLFLLCIVFTGIASLMEEEPEEQSNMGVIGGCLVFAFAVVLTLLGV